MTHFLIRLKDIYTILSNFFKKMFENIRNIKSGNTTPSKILFSDGVMCKRVYVGNTMVWNLNDYVLKVDGNEDSELEIYNNYTTDNTYTFSGNVVSIDLDGNKIPFTVTTSIDDAIITTTESSYTITIPLASSPLNGDFYFAFRTPSSDIYRSNLGDNLSFFSDWIISNSILSHKDCVVTIKQNVSEGKTLTRSYTGLGKSFDNIPYRIETNDSWLHVNGETVSVDPFLQEPYTRTGTLKFIQETSNNTLTAKVIQRKDSIRNDEYGIFTELPNNTLNIPSTERSGNAHIVVKKRTFIKRVNGERIPNSETSWITTDLKPFTVSNSTNFTVSGTNVLRSGNVDNKHNLNVVSDRMTFTLNNGVNIAQGFGSVSINVNHQADTYKNNGAILSEYRLNTPQNSNVPNIPANGSSINIPLTMSYRRYKLWASDNAKVYFESEDWKNDSQAVFTSQKISGESFNVNGLTVSGSVNRSETNKVGTYRFISNRSNNGVSLSADIQITQLGRVATSTTRLVNQVFTVNQPNITEFSFEYNEVGQNKGFSVTSTITKETLYTDGNYYQTEVMTLPFSLVGSANWVHTEHQQNTNSVIINVDKNTALSSRSFTGSINQTGGPSSKTIAFKVTQGAMRVGSYTINHYEVGTTKILSNETTVRNIEVGTRIRVSDSKKSDITGFEFDSVKDEFITVGDNTIVVNACYYRRKNYRVTINHILKDSTTPVADPTILNLPFEKTISVGEHKVTLDTHLFDSVTPTSIKVSNIESNNVATCYYTKKILKNRVKFKVTHNLCNEETVPGLFIAEKLSDGQFTDISKVFTHDFTLDLIVGKTYVLLRRNNGNDFINLRKQETPQNTSEPIFLGHIDNPTLDVQGEPSHTDIINVDESTGASNNIAIKSGFITNVIVHGHSSSGDTYNILFTYSTGESSGSLTSSYISQASFRNIRENSPTPYRLLTGNCRDISNVDNLSRNRKPITYINVTRSDDQHIPVDKYVWSDKVQYSEDEILPAHTNKRYLHIFLEKQTRSVTFDYTNKTNRIDYKTLALTEIKPNGDYVDVYTFTQGETKTLELDINKTYAFRRIKGYSEIIINSMYDDINSDIVKLGSLGVEFNPSNIKESSIIRLNNATYFNITEELRVKRILLIHDDGLNQNNLTYKLNMKYSTGIYGGNPKYITGDNFVGGGNDNVIYMYSQTDDPYERSLNIETTKITRSDGKRFQVDVAKFSETRSIQSDASENHGQYLHLVVGTYRPKPPKAPAPPVPPTPPETTIPQDPPHNTDTNWGVPNRDEHVSENYTIPAELNVIGQSMGGYNTNPNSISAYTSYNFIIEYKSKDDRYSSIWSSIKETTFRFNNESHIPGYSHYTGSVVFNGKFVVITNAYVSDQRGHGNVRANFTTSNFDGNGNDLSSYQKLNVTYNPS